MMTRIFTPLSTPETAQDREMRECIDALAALEERGPNPLLFARTGLSFCGWPGRHAFRSALPVNGEPYSNAYPAGVRASGSPGRAMVTRCGLAPVRRGDTAQWCMMMARSPTHELANLDDGFADHPRSSTCRTPLPACLRDSVAPWLTDGLVRSRELFWAR